MQEIESNILDTLKLDTALRIAKKKSKEGSSGEARTIYKDILYRFPKNKKAIDGIKALLSNKTGKASEVQDPPQDRLQLLINLYEKGQLEQALNQATGLMRQFPNSVVLYNICGLVYQGLGQLDAAISNFKQAISIKPGYADIYSNMGLALQEKNNSEEAIEAYKKALAIKPDYAEAYSNMGNAFQDQGKLEESIEAYKKALAIKPDYADAHYNLGNALQNQGKPGEALTAYKKALKINF